MLGDGADVRGAAFVAVRDDGAILLRMRPEKGLLGGMSEVPTTGWTARVDGETSADSAPFPADWRRAGSISHVFTHFSLELNLAVYLGDRYDTLSADDGEWWPLHRLEEAGLPTLFAKAARLGLAAAGELA